ncbi:MAG: GxxExxY protein [Bacteroidetes bacterium]|jgi:GxxExxY protein|nr:GxxExxY protein [Bacteroidota bacterium]
MNEEEATQGRRMTENEISKTLVDVFIRVHSQLGPGLLESVYETAICYELDKRALNYKRQQGIAVYYDSMKMDLGFRADIIVEEKVIVEIKSIESVLPVHHKTLLTYLKLTNKKLGLMVNFNVNLVKDRITRIVNNL